MPYMKQGSNFLYDDTTGEIVGVKDPNGTDRYFASSTFNDKGVRQRGRSFILEQWAVPVGIAQTGSIGNNGALTLGGSGFQVTYSGGIWLYFPANAISAGSAAGFYWTVMSSATAGTIYNTTLGDTVPYVPTRNIAFVTTGPGAYTGHTSKVSLATVTVPGGSMGLNGGLLVDVLASCMNSGTTKTFGITLGGSSIYSRSIGASTVMREIASVRNMNSQAVNLVNTAQVSVGVHTTSGAAVRRTVNTAADSNVVIEGTLATATDYLILEGATIEVLPR